MKISMKTKIFILLAGLITAGAATNVIVSHFELPAVKVTVRVVDENQQPVENANVWFAFKDRATFNDLNIRGLTDANGLFTGEGGCDAAGIGCGITKEGYYGGGASIPRFIEHDNVLNHWKPWGETYTTMLRPIGKPVALYAKTVKLRIPTLNKPCGFDLEIGDWVAPYGKGMKPDFIFALQQEDRGMQDYDVLGELTFKNPLDGLLEVPKPVVAYSEFKWERQAPENGYRAKFQLQNSWHKEKGITESFKFGNGIWEGYFFRIRTVEQDGKIVSARYGKIRGGIEVFPDNPNPKITFTYYFNPTPNDRNLEWDQKRNLFGGLTDMETPREP
jgi:hypothetical protein